MIQTYTKNSRILAIVIAILAASGAYAQGTQDIDIGNAFATADQDRNGKLSHDEAIADKEIAISFEGADTDHNGSIDKQEYIAFKTASETQRPEQFPDDNTVTSEVKAKIANALHDRDISNIKVETYKGQVYLLGYVSNEQQSALAVTAAKQVLGVSAVKNGLVAKG